MANCYDERPPQPREPLVVASELARRGGKLQIEAAKIIRQLHDDQLLWMSISYATEEFLAGRSTTDELKQTVTGVLNNIRAS